MEKRMYIDKAVHSYIKSDMVYTPVSTLLNMYKQPFNREYWGWRKGYEQFMLEKHAEEIKHLSEDSQTRKIKGMVKDQISKVIMTAKIPYADGNENLDLLLDTIMANGEYQSTIEPYRDAIYDIWDGKRDSASLKGNSYHRGREYGAIKRGFETNGFDNKEYTVHNELLLNAYPESNDPTFTVSEE